MIFVEFTVTFPNDRPRYHFVGRSLEDIFADTNDGRKFGSARFTSHREVSREEVECLNLKFFEAGVKTIQRGTSISFGL